MESYTTQLATDHRFFMQQLISFYRKKNGFMRTPTLVTTEGDQPCARTVVLRDIFEEQFIFFTDVRSKKVQQLHHCPKACLHGYDPHKQLQLVGYGVLEKISHHPQLKSWQHQASQRLEDYIGVKPPGSLLAPGEKQAFERQYGEKNICILGFSPYRWDILQLNSPHHHRFHWVLENGQWISENLAP
ncbi:MAG: pyridoxamine 5'-phosphate oxidase family protein [Alphaproteobacteria bacterium]